MNSPFADLIARLDRQSADLQRLRDAAVPVTIAGVLALHRGAIYSRMIGTVDQAVAELSAGATVH